jgi:hypothetical protein
VGGGRLGLGEVVLPPGQEHPEDVDDQAGEELTALWPILPAIMAAMQAQISQRMMKVDIGALVASVFGPVPLAEARATPPGGRQGGLPTVG